MNACFVCETPFNIFNCLNFVLSQTDFAFDTVDLFIGEKFPKVDSIIQVLASKGIFSSIYKYSYEIENARTSVKVKRLIMPGRYISDLLGSRDSVSKKQYDAIFFASLTRFVRAFIISHPDITPYLYEDGAGTYYGRSGLSFVSTKERIAYKLIGSDFRKLFPKRVYVNNPGLCESQWTDDIRELHKSSENDINTRALFEELFGEVPKIYSQKRIVYLSQPFDQYDEANSPFAGKLRHIFQDKEIVYRPHPREKDYLFKDSSLENSGILWEVVCNNCITDQHILIGRCSSAQINPKWIFDKEPFLIFTFPFTLQKDSFIYDTYEKIYLKTKSIYRNKGKVQAVESIDELNDLVLQFSQGQIQE